MSDKYVKKRDKQETYRDMLCVMRNQIRKMDSIIQYQSREIERLENNVCELKNIIGKQKKQNQDYIDANHIDQPHTNIYDSSDDISITSQDSISSQTMMINELGGTVKKIYIQRTN